MKRNGLISVIIWCFVSCSFVGRGRFSFLIKQINSTCTCYCVFWPIVIVSQYICLKGLRNHYNSVKSSNHWFNWLINAKLSISLLLKETLVLRHVANLMFQCPLTNTCILFCILVIGQTCSESNKRNTEALPTATVSLQSYSSPGWRVTYYP